MLGWLDSCHSVDCNQMLSILESLELDVLVGWRDTRPAEPLCLGSSTFCSCGWPGMMFEGCPPQLLQHTWKLPTTGAKAHLKAAHHSYCSTFEGCPPQVLQHIWRLSISCCSAFSVSYWYVAGNERLSKSALDTGPNDSLTYLSMPGWEDARQSEVPKHNQK